MIVHPSIKDIMEDVQKKMEKQSNLCRDLRIQINVNQILKACAGALWPFCTDSANIHHYNPHLSPTRLLRYLHIRIWCIIDSVLPENGIFGDSITCLFKYFLMLFFLAAFLPLTTTKPLSLSAAMLYTLNGVH